MDKIKKLLLELNIQTKKINLYIEAMTHNSYQNEHRLNYNYQRLEFLGDAIISKIVAYYLYLLDQNESEMTDNRKILVKTETLQKACDDLNLLDYAYLGNGINREHDTNKMKADLFESLIGAIYIDQGEVKIYEILKKTIFNYYENDLLEDTIDYKTKMQEYFHTITIGKPNLDSLNTIQYRISNDGLDKKIFIAELYFNNICYGTGKGFSKKQAEMKAAKEAYNKRAEIDKK